MASNIEDYALIGNCRSAALVDKTGSIDWYCVPRFDAPACFAALLGQSDHGRWRIGPRQESKVRRQYMGDTLVLETIFETTEGEAAIIDFMPMRRGTHELVRIVQGRRGAVAMDMELVIRFDYGSTVPWVRRLPRGLMATAGPNTMRLLTNVPLVGKAFTTVASFQVHEGQEVPFVLSWHPSHHRHVPDLDPYQGLQDTLAWWRRWSKRVVYQGDWKPAVVRSLITLKALTYQPSGGVLAAPTTSLPEALGGNRNWDYRFCWLRDATFTLYALLIGGYREESAAWRGWLLRAIAGRPEQIQVLYGLAGERWLSEIEVPWLPGYGGAAPVRVGNAASDQLQLDMVGEIMDAFHVAHKSGVKPLHRAWRVQCALLRWFEGVWQRPDQGIWETRGQPQHFTHSKVMAWVAFDRAVKAIQRFGMEGPLERWQAVRAQIHDEVCEKAWDADKQAFVQAYGSPHLDAATLLMPLVGFLPATDARMVSTVHAIEQNLLHDGLLRRYRTESGVDGLSPGEGLFLICSFWLADNYELQGRHQDAVALFERLTGLCNDVGLLAEEYDPTEKRHLGNFPQALSHVGLINSARNLSASPGVPAHRRHKP